MMDGMNRNLDGVKLYVNEINTLCNSLKQELGEKLYEYPGYWGTWFEDSTIQYYYEQKDEIWAIQLSSILRNILKNEPDLSEGLKKDIENEIMSLDNYSVDIQRERSEHIPKPDEFFFVKSTRSNIPLEELAKILSKTDVLEPLVCEFNQSYEWKDYSKGFLVGPEQKMIPEGDKYLRICVPGDVADVRNLYGYLQHKIELLSNTHNADLVETLVLHNDFYMNSAYMNKALTLTKYDSIDDMIKNLEKDGTKRQSIMDRLAKNIEKVKAKNAEQSDQPVKAHEKSEYSER